MNSKTLTLTFALAGSLALAALAELGDASKLPPAAKKQVTYDKDIKPLFEASCVKCHSGEKPKGKYSMESKEKVLKGGADAAAIIVGDSAKSPLVHYSADLVVDMEMPPTDKRDKYKALTKEEIGLVRAWIDQGAK